MNMKTDTCKFPGSFRFVSLGDVHLGHPNTPTEHIIRNLNTYVVTDTLLKDIDMLIITGDLYDHILTNADDATHQINEWITRLLFRCAAHRVKLRVVEGTPSHDRKQSRFFVEQAKNLGVEVDLHYAQTLSIEYVADLDINILYVPDKWREHTDTTLAEVRELLIKHNLEKVDFAIMHGAFEYQLPSIVPEPTHCSKTYLDLVRYYILIGHVHHPTRLDRILAAGSFDRLCHNEEEPKGFYSVVVKPGGSDTVKFLANKGAKIYKTIDCVGLDTKALNVTLRKVVAEVPKGSAVRLRCHRHDPANGDLKVIQETYPDVIWSVTLEEGEKKTTKGVMDAFKSIDLEEFLPITKNNITTLVVNEIEKHASDATLISASLKRFEELINER